MRTLVSAVALLPLMLGAAAAQPCNPVIDGTYCAELGRRPAPSGTGRSSISLPPVQNIGTDLTVGMEQPATFGAITFQNTGSRCIGLLRRGACN